MMKKVFQSLGLLILAFISTVNLFAQTPSIDAAYDPANITQSQFICPSKECARLYNPYNVNNALHSNTNWGGTLLLAQRVTLPNQTGCKPGVFRIPTFMQGFSGMQGGATFYQSAGNVPGAQFYTTTDFFIQQFGSEYVVPQDLQKLFTPGQTLWMSFFGIPNPPTTASPRMFWGMVTPAANSANGNPGMAVNYSGAPFGGAACPQWTPGANCAVLGALGANGLGYEIILCAAGGLTLGGSPVPTMSQWGLFLFGLVLLTLAVVTLYNFSTRKANA